MAMRRMRAPRCGWHRRCSPLLRRPGRRDMRTELHSRGRTVIIGPDEPFVVIGERINPTGRKQRGGQMAAGDFSAVRRDAVMQAAAGAQGLDVNAGYPMGDEASMLRDAVRAAQEATEVPLALD